MLTRLASECIVAVHKHARCGTCCEHRTAIHSCVLDDEHQGVGGLISPCTPASNLSWAHGEIFFRGQEIKWPDFWRRGKKIRRFWAPGAWLSMPQACVASGGIPPKLAESALAVGTANFFRPAFYFRKIFRELFRRRPGSEKNPMLCAAPVSR